MRLPRYGGRPIARALLAGVLAGTVAAAAASALPPASPPTLSLVELEERLAVAPGVLATQAQVDAAGHEVRYRGARASGFEYFLENQFGPRSDIVTQDVNNSTLRYGQRVGVRLPLGGTRLAAQSELLDARSKERLARLEANGQQRDLYGKLRDSYIAYWQYWRQRNSEHAYLKLEAQSATAARALRRDGFWTQGQYLDFLDTLERFRADLAIADASRHAALAQIRGQIAADVAEFRPAIPDFERNCNPPVEATVSRAVAADEQAAGFAELLAATNESLGYVKHSSVASDAVLGVGTVLDTPRGVGYDVSAGLAVSIPQHNKAEESAKRSELLAQAAAYRQQRAQRIAGVRASVLAALADIASSQEAFSHDRIDVTAKTEDLREARVRLETQVTQGAAGFADVQTALADAYVAQRAAGDAEGTLYLRLNALEKVAPGACLARRP